MSSKLTWWQVGMLRTRWYKVISDLWSHRTRTLIVALAVAVGVYSVGSILAVQALMLREFHDDRDAARIASAIITTFPFDQELADRIAEMPGVAGAEGRRSLDARVVTGPDTRRNIQIVAVDDFENMQVDRFPLVAGAWPTQKDEIMVEWMGLDYIGAQIGDTITVELDDNTHKHLTITGTVHDPQRPSPSITGFTTAVVSPETMVYLGEPYLFDAAARAAGGREPRQGGGPRRGGGGRRPHRAQRARGVRTRPSSASPSSNPSSTPP